VVASENFGFSYSEWRKGRYAERPGWTGTMTSELWMGLGAVILAGGLQGVFAVPMKYATRWSYENIWLVYGLSGMLVLPWLLTSATVPHAGQVYSLSSGATLFRIFGFGLCWGIGSALAGIGLMMLGIGLGMAIILGLSASLGSLIPLLILHPQQLHTREGHTYLAGTAIMLAGIALCARAGILRDQVKNRELEAAPRASFLAGFTVCCLSGLFSSALNFSYAFGGEAVQRALELGASALWSTGVVTALAVTGGFVANLIYCGYLLWSHGSLGKFLSPGAGVGWFCGGLMGLFWFGGQSLYGLGISHMGSLGVVIGWPLLMGMIIITSNGAGILTREWNGVSGPTKRFLGAGMVMILMALGVLAAAQRGS
jgi:L-rhamnose-H+ transport protein